MKKAAIIILVLFLSTGIKAQQLPLFTQYMHNDYMINPAVAGTHNYYQIRSNHRFQWLSIENAPVSNMISMYGPFQEYDMGWGAYIYSDVTGPFSNTGIFGSYAYNYPLNDQIKISGGISAGFYQVRLDGNKITYLQEGDPMDKGSVDARFVPDATVGAYLYSSNFHVGISVHQLVNNKVRFFKSEILQANIDTSAFWDRMKSHFFLTGGYKYFINRDFAVESAGIIKAVKAAPPQVDISAKVIYQNMVWLGTAFRTIDAVSLLAGYSYENKIYIGYSYDVGIGKFRAARHGGAHELFVSYKFNPIKD